MSSVIERPSAPKSAYQSLRRRQRRFVDEYLTGKKAAEAMAAIGFKGKRPDNAAYRFLCEPQVKAAIEERRAVICEAVGVRQEAVLAKMLQIADDDAHKDQARMLVELAEITGLKKVAAVQQALGPGMQIIVQQNIVAANDASGPVQLGVVVNLPGPG